MKMPRWLRRSLVIVLVPLWCLWLWPRWIVRDIRKGYREGRRRP